MKYLNMLTAISLGAIFAMPTSAVHAAPYILFQAGSAKNQPLQNWVSNQKKSAPTARLALGGDYQISDVFRVGLEAGAQGYKRKSQSFGNLGRVNAQRVTLDALAVADFYLTEKFDVKLKGGIAHVQPRTKIEVEKSDGPSASRNLTKKASYIVPKTMLGIGYDIVENVNFNLGVGYEFAKNKDSKGSSSILAGLQFKFA